jgi:hypothetical protein
MEGEAPAEPHRSAREDVRPPPEVRPPEGTPSTFSTTYR